MSRWRISWPQIHPAGLLLISAFVLMSLLFRKSFCSWLCPVGTFSEYLWKLGRYTFRRNFTLPRWLDVRLRGMKYLLLGFFGYAVATMSAPAIAEFLSAPYGLIVDVRMLNFFRFLGGTAAFVVLGLVVASIFVQNFWCRYLCPYGALMGLVSHGRARCASGAKQSACIDCAKCAKACPASLPVDKLVQIRSAECTGCLECVAVCPAQGRAGVRRARPPRDASVGHGRGHCHCVCGISGLRQAQRPLGHAPAAADLLPTSAARRRRAASRGGITW